MTLENLGKRIPSLPIDKISDRDLARTIGNALLSDFGEFASRDKRVARAAGAGSEKTAANWILGHNAPSMLYGLRLMAKSPTMAKEILRLCALEQDLDPDFQREFAALMQRVGRL